MVRFCNHLTLDSSTLLAIVSNQSIKYLLSAFHNISLKLKKTSVDNWYRT